jgi:hypothetical protein
MAAPRPVLRFGMWMAWSVSALYVVYIATLFAGGVASGVPREPYLSVAEVLTTVGAVLQVALFAAIHECTRPGRRIFSLTALGWMFAMATLTMAAHVAQLTVARRIDLTAIPDMSYVYGWEWPSLLYAIELTAWHLLFGLSLLFAAPVFAGRGRPATVGLGLYLAGALCLIGLIGPAVGNLGWRFIGVVGYGVVFPAVCVVLALVFRDAAQESAMPAAA